MANDLFCPVHKEITGELTLIKTRQETRHCQAHEAQIRGLVDDIIRVDKVNDAQWLKIDRLMIMVYSAGPVTALLAFLGSLLGTYLKGR